MAEGDSQAIHLAGKYRLIRRIGAGGMAEVYLAQQTGMDGFEKLVVIKRIHAHMAEERKFVRMFLDEARTAADLRHPSIVQVFDVGEAEGTYFIAMEFLHGRNLREIQKRAPNERLELRHALHIIREAAEGLHYAHQKCDINGEPLGIVHRDVSPHNIIVTYEGATKIVDFGIAKAASRTTRTAPGMVMGKVSYMSPEQARGRELDARSDQFSLGVVLYEITTGEYLFRRENDTSTLQAVMDCAITPPREINGDYPPDLQAIVMKALARDPVARFEDCAAFADALEEYMAETGMVPSRTRLRDYVRSLFSDASEEIPEEPVAQKRWAATTAHFLGHTEAEEDLEPEEGGLSMPSLASAATQLDPSQSQVAGGSRPAPSRNRGWVPVGLVLLALLAVAAGVRYWPRQTVAPTPTPIAAETTPTAVATTASTTPTPTRVVVATPVHTRRPTPRRTPVVLPGTLRVKARPWAEVWVDGRRVARQTPATVPRLSVGSHELIVRNDPAAFEVKRTVEIRGGETLEVFVNVLDGKVELQRIKGR